MKSTMKLFEALSSNESLVNCHPLTEYPDRAWDDLKPSRLIEELKPLALDTPIKTDHVRFVCISDTHSKISEELKNAIPPGDVLIHAGDFTNFGGVREVQEFNHFLGTLPHKYKVVIAGNHEISFDKVCAEKFATNYNWPPSGEKRASDYFDPRELLTNCKYLEDSLTELYGISIYGSPWTPIHDYWAFNLRRGKACLSKWNQIPENVDILVTHGPPIGYGDYCASGVRAGCVELLLSVQNRIKPKYHVYGHIHEGYGVRSDGKTIYVNCSICDVHYRQRNAPVIFDLPLKAGFEKS